MSDAPTNPRLIRAANEAALVIERDTLLAALEKAKGLIRRCSTVHTEAAMAGTTRPFSDCLASELRVFLSSFETARGDGQ